MPSAVTRYGRRAIRARVRSQIWGELVCVLLFPALFFGYLGQPVTAANAVGIGLTAWQLSQGAAYWVIKLHGLGRRLDPVWWKVYRVLRWLDPALLAVGGLVIVATITGAPRSDWAVGATFWLLAVLEYVNYFHWQLMYDNRTDLAWLRAHGVKRSALARDLVRGPRRAAPGPR